MGLHWPSVLATEREETGILFCQREGGSSGFPFSFAKVWGGQFRFCQERGGAAAFLGFKGGGCLLLAGRVEEQLIKGGKSGEGRRLCLVGGFKEENRRRQNWCLVALRKDESLGFSYLLFFGRLQGRRNGQGEKVPAEGDLVF